MHLVKESTPVGSRIFLNISVLRWLTSLNPENHKHDQQCQNSNRDANVDSLVGAHPCFCASTTTHRNTSRSNTNRKIKQSCYSYRQKTFQKIIYPDTLRFTGLASLWSWGVIPNDVELKPYDEILRQLKIQSVFGIGEMFTSYLQWYLEKGTDLLKLTLYASNECALLL